MKAMILPLVLAIAITAIASVTNGKEVTFLQAI